jgi:hypothetical protein
MDAAESQGTTDGAANVSWMYKNGKGLWIPYSTEDNAALEAAFLRGDTAPVDLGGLYEVDLQTRRQKRLSSSHEREV